MKHKSIFNWSTGKDSALALYKIRQSNEYEILSLLTSVNSHFNRVSMHGIRRELLQAQATSIGLPLHCLEIPENPSMEDYEAIMQENLAIFKQKGLSHSIFGDIFLEDLRAYREEKLKKMNIEAVFPLWKQDTTALIQEFLSLGFKSIVTCVDKRHLDQSFVGRIIDEDFIQNLPSGVDPCGENGEYHSFCFDGPIFKQPIDFDLGEIVYKTYHQPQNTNSGTACDTLPVSPEMGFWYIDLLPK